MNRQQYIQEYERIQRKYRKKFFPAVYKAINSIVSSLIDKIQADGVQSAMGDLMLTIINDKIGEPVKRIYSEVGMFHVKHNYRFIRAEIGRKALGRNEIWVQEIIAYLEKNLWQYVVAKPTETLRDHFLRVLQEGIDKEWSVDDIIREIRSDQFARYQAERIVRTEVGRAANTGKKIAADSFPYEMQKEWISFQDMRTRGRVPDDKKDHYHLNGQTVAMDGMFTDPRSGEQIEYPNAPGGSPGMVINCRCTYATTPKRDSAGGLIARAAKINVGIKPTEDRFFENGGGVVKPVVSETQKPVFKPAKTLNEAATWAKENLGVKYADFTGLDIGVANDINKAVFNIKTVMPDIRTYGIGSAQAANKAAKQKLMAEYKESDWYKGNVEKWGQRLADAGADAFVNRHVSRVGNGTIAWSTNNETAKIPGGKVIDMKEFVGVFVNQKEGKSKASIDAIVRQNRDKKWFTESANDFGYIMTHEIGHEIDKTIGFRASKEFLEIYKREDALGVQSVTNKLSAYAATAGGRASHKPFEMIAEGWAEFMTSENPRPLAKEIGELMLKKYYEKSVVDSGVSFSEWYSQILKIIKQ